jgi:hypothetical protein
LLSTWASRSGSYSQTAAMPFSLNVEVWPRAEGFIAIFAIKVAAN